MKSNIIENTENLKKNSMNIINNLKNLPDQEALENLKKENIEVKNKISNINYINHKILSKINDLVNLSNSNYNNYDNDFFNNLYDNINDNILLSLDSLKNKDKRMAGQNLLLEDNKPQNNFKDIIDNSLNLFIPKIKVKYNLKYNLEENILYAQNNYDSFIKSIRNLTEEEKNNCLSHPYNREINELVFDKNLYNFNGIGTINIFKNTYIFIDTEYKLKMFINEAKNHKEIAIDLEHHNERSFLGFTCLIQISTNDNDYILDCLKIREYLYLLNEITTNQNIIKILHGSQMDIQWLQKDFGIYIVNLFDTYLACKELKFSNCSLANLLFKYCNVITNKKYQLSDWRQRPLDDKMIEYARIDTHYLFYIFNNLKKELIDYSKQFKKEEYYYIKEVFTNSKNISLIKFKKPKLFSNTYYNILNNQINIFNNFQISVFKKLWEFRNKIAREIDESEHFIMNNHLLLKISSKLPLNKTNFRKCLSFSNFNEILLNYEEDILIIINKLMNFDEKKVLNNLNVKNDNLINLVENNINMNFENLPDIKFNYENNNIKLVNNDDLSFSNFIKEFRIYNKVDDISKEYDIKYNNFVNFDINKEKVEIEKNENYIEIDIKNKNTIKNSTKKEIIDKLDSINLPESLKQRFNLNLNQKKDVIVENLNLKEIKKIRRTNNDKFEENVKKYQEKIENINKQDFSKINLFNENKKKAKKQKFKNTKFGKVNINKNIKF